VHFKARQRHSEFNLQPSTHIMDLPTTRKLSDILGQDFEDSFDSVWDVDWRCWLGIATRGLWNLWTISARGYLKEKLIINSHPTRHRRHKIRSLSFNPAMYATGILSSGRFCDARSEILREGGLRRTCMRWSSVGDLGSIVQVLDASSVPPKKLIFRFSQNGNTTLSERSFRS